MPRQAEQLEPLILPTTSRRIQAGGIKHANPASFTADLHQLPATDPPARPRG